MDHSGDSLGTRIIVGLVQRYNFFLLFFWQKPVNSAYYTMLHYQPFCDRSSSLTITFKALLDFLDLTWRTEYQKIGIWRIFHEIKSINRRSGYVGTIFLELIGRKRKERQSVYDGEGES